MHDISPEDLDRIRRGDAGALDAVYRAVGDRVYRLCLGMLGQPADAEDAAQEVLLRILDKAHTFRGGSRFSTWVHRLTMNHCLNRRRSLTLLRQRGGARLEGLDPASDAPTPESEADAAEERAALHELIQAMSPEHRAVLVLRELEQLDYQAIADALEIPVGTVMSRLSRARTTLLRRSAGLRQ